MHTFPQTCSPRTRAGFTMIEIMIVMAVIAVIAMIAIPNLLASKTATNEAATVGNLKTFATAQFQYHKKNDFFAGSATQLQVRNLLSGDFKHAFLNHHDNGDALVNAKAGYYFWVLHGDSEDDTGWILDLNDSPEYNMVTFGATARASEPYRNGDNQYFISEEGTIYKKAEPALDDAKYKQFLLESLPNRPPTTWTAAR